MTRWFRRATEASGFMRRAVITEGFTDDQVLDAFFGSKDLSERLLGDEPFTDSDYPGFLEECRRTAGGEPRYSPGSSSYLMTSIIAEASSDYSIRPSDLYRSCRDSLIFEHLMKTATAILHQDDESEYARYESELVDLYLEWETDRNPQG